MTQTEILQKVQSVLSQTFALDSNTIKMDSRLIEDLDLDSLDAIDLVVKLEEATGHRMDEASLRTLRTVGDVVAFLESRLHS